MDRKPIPTVDENKEQKEDCTLPGFMDETRRMSPVSCVAGFLEVLECLRTRKGSYTSELSRSSIIIYGGCEDITVFHLTFEDTSVLSLCIASVMWAAVLCVLLFSPTQARRVVVAGNWKANGGGEAGAWVQAINQVKVRRELVEVIVAPALPYLDTVTRQLRKDFAVAAQTCSQYPPGPYTGEVPAEMISELGVSWVILGHSERRQFSGETNQIITEKLTRALVTGLKVILCIGETIYDMQTAETTLISQLSPVIPLISDWNRVIIAYEPVWAIGTGHIASISHITSMHTSIRDYVTQHSGNSTNIDALRVIYGGSVSSNNCGEILRREEVDGVLVGAASVRPEFRSIIEVADTVAQEKERNKGKSSL